MYKNIVDWAVTVDWQAWATALSAFAIIYAAKVAQSTLADYRDKIRTERSEKAREDYLALAYGLKHQFRAVLKYWLRFKKEDENKNLTQIRLTHEITDKIFEENSAIIPNGCIFFGNRVWEIFDALANKAFEIRVSRERDFDGKKNTLSESEVMKEIEDLITELEALKPTKLTP